MVDAKLRPALPYGVPASGRFGPAVGAPGVRACLLAGHDIVLVQPFAGSEAAASAKLSGAFGTALPAIGRASTGNALTLAWAGAGTWLASGRIDGLAARLAAALGDSAAAIDQTDGRCLFRISGPDARRTLEKGTTLDLHPRAFGPGQSAATPISHISAGIRAIDEIPSYEVAISRSFAADFWHWLMDSASEYGLELAPSDV